jgi:long-subunit fatty acid transport protein
VSDRFSVGLGVSYFDGELETRTALFAPVEATLPEGLFGPNTYATEARLLTQSAAFDDTSWSWNGGLLWTLSDRWRVGGFYRRGPRFFGAGGEISGPALEPTVPEGTVLSYAESPMRLPDVFGAGAAFRSEDGSVTVSLEWDHINYSVLIESFEPGIVDPDVRLDDGDELHVGLEYVFISWTPLIGLRGGIWVDPEHRIRYEGGDPLSRAVFRPGETTYHYAFGFGLAWKGFQMDLGVDLSHVVETASLSAIVSF